MAISSNAFAWWLPVTLEARFGDSAPTRDRQEVAALTPDARNLLPQELNSPHEVAEI
jgi:hypothetical protein